jgi:hypothetical protein
MKSSLSAVKEWLNGLSMGESLWKTIHGREDRLEAIFVNLDDR